MSGPYGVLVTSLGASTYTVSIVAVDGKVVASAQASSPASVSCGASGAAYVPLPVSTSNSRAYYMDAQGVVSYLAPTGESGRATTVPAGTGSRRSMFAVSPDDQRIAVIVDDFTSGGASTRLYAEDLAGAGNHIELFSDSGAFTLWPTGWHGGTTNLVVAKVPACPQSGVPACCVVQEFHVVDPTTANRRFTMGGADCLIDGPPTPAGAICLTTSVDAFQVDWTGKRAGLGVADRKFLLYLSPDGKHIARYDGTSTAVTEGAVFAGQNNTKVLNLTACGWIDDTHVFSGGNVQQQPRVGDFTNGNVLPIAAQGDCAGRIPGGL